MPAGEEWQGGSGFKQLYYKLSGAETGEHVLDGPGATVTITQEGVTTLTYYSTDWAGNQGPERTLTIRIRRLHVDSQSAQLHHRRRRSDWRR